MKVLASLKRPEYLFRPAQILRRLRCELRRARPGYQTITLPWGLPLRIRPAEELGWALCRAGVFELAVCESISRLVDPGDLAVDAGANCGLMTSLMAMRAGAEGRIVAFEPHPEIFAELRHNISSWANGSNLAPSNLAPIVARESGLSNRDGTANLFVPPGFRINRGVAFLEGSSTKRGEWQYLVTIERLDSAFKTTQKIGFLKIDVEGHQLQVIEGAEQLLDAGAIRDIVFEETVDPETLKAGSQPQTWSRNEVAEFLKTKGYVTFSVFESLFGPVLSSNLDQSAIRRRLSPTYLATREPERLLARMSWRGWTALKRSRTPAAAHPMQSA